MAYVPGFTHDLFVSYAHVDNIPAEANEPGWVDALFRNIEVSLNMKMGRKNLAKIWRDRQDLRGNQEVTGHIDDQVKSSALLLLVLSPAYLASQACLRELETFTRLNSSDRIFVVWKDPSEKTHQPVPPEIRDLRKYNFWFTDGNNKTRTLGWPVPRPNSDDDRRYYYPVIVDLVADVCDALENLAAKIGSSVTVTAGTTAPTTAVASSLGGPGNAVLLAEVTDDLDRRRGEVRSYLSLAGIGALPTGSYRLTRSEFERAFVADLKASQAFVQLLGPYGSKAPPDVPEGFCRLQLDLARAHGVPILQWRDPELDLDNVTPTQRALLEGVDVRAVPIEEFKRTIADLFLPPVAEAPRVGTFLFVNASDADLESAQDLIAALDDHVEWTMPLYDPNDTAEIVQLAAETNLINSDALVFLYGKANPRWVLGQLDLYRKLKPQRSSAPKLLILVNAPPEPKIPIPIKLQGMKILTFKEAADHIKISLGA